VLLVWLQNVEWHDVKPTFITVKTFGTLNGSNKLSFTMQSLNTMCSMWHIYLELSEDGKDGPFTMGIDCHTVVRINTEAGSARQDLGPNKNLLEHVFAYYYIWNAWLIFWTKRCEHRTSLPHANVAFSVVLAKLVAAQGEQPDMAITGSPEAR
jgi:hypothetical protein